MEEVDEQVRVEAGKRSLIEADEASSTGEGQGRRCSEVKTFTGSS